MPYNDRRSLLSNQICKCEMQDDGTQLSDVIHLCNKERVV
jgi:hypothetical protein